MGDLAWTRKKMVRLVVAALFVCALAYGFDFEEAVVPESDYVEPMFQDEMELVQKTPETPDAQVKVDTPKKELFKVVRKKYVKVPKEAGDQAAYASEKQNQHNQEQASNSASITAAERSAGLKAASDVLKKDQEIKRSEALKH